MADTSQAKLGQDLGLREMQVLRAAADGLDINATGRKLFVSPQTVKMYRATLYVKLGVRNMAHAVAVAFRRELIS